MKETVPSQDSVERAVQIQRSHVGNAPFLLGEAVRAHGDHRARRVNPGQAAAVFDQVPGHRHTASAADVEHGGLGGQQCEEPVEPTLFLEAVAAIARPSDRVPLVEVNHPAGGGIHGYQRYTTASFPPVHLIHGFEPSAPQCMRKFTRFFGSQLAPATVLQSTAPGDDTTRESVVALP
jgi:hypothetical protein